MAIIGLLVNGLLAIVKLLAGILGSSAALVADAVESMTDMAGSLAVWGGLKLSARPPDADHPYGHGKAEPLTALAVAIMIFGAGLGICIEAIRQIRTPHHAPEPYTLWVLITVVVIKELLYQAASRVGRAADSSAVLADAWHHRSDALTSIAAAIGITAALWGGPGWEPADDWAALVATGVIFFNAARLGLAPLHELMDAAPADLVEQARAAAARVGGVAGVEKVFARKSGGGYWVDMHVEVDPHLPVRDAHRIAHDVKDRVRADLPRVIDVLVHIEPFGDS
jgi:cation diffusion facilitator family transporter